MERQAKLKAVKLFKYPEQPERIRLTFGGRHLPKGIASVTPDEWRSLRKTLRARGVGTT